MKRIIIDSNLNGVIAGNTTLVISMTATYVMILTIIILAKGTAGLLEFEEVQPRMSTRKLAE